MKLLFLHGRHRSQDTQYTFVIFRLLLGHSRYRVFTRGIHRVDRTAGCNDLQSLPPNADVVTLVNILPCKSQSTMVESCAASGLPAGGIASRRRRQLSTGSRCTVQQFKLLRGGSCAEWDISSKLLVAYDFSVVSILFRHFPVCSCTQFTGVSRT